MATPSGSVPSLPTHGIARRPRAADVDVNLIESESNAMGGLPILRQQTRSGRWVAILLTLAIGLGACAGRKLEQAAAFADAAMLFEDKIPVITNSAFDVVTEADSVVLLATRGRISDPKIRRKSLNDANQDLREILKSMSEIKANAVLLKDFFVTLRTLATSSADQKIGESLNGLVGQMDDLSKKLTKNGGFIRRNGGDAIERILKTGATFVVREIQHGAVRDILKRYGPTVKNTLAVQEAYIAALRLWVEADASTLLKVKEKEAVVDAYVRRGSLSSSWPARRLAALRATTDLSALAEAETAARRVKQAFDALAENKLGIGHIQSITEQLSKIAAVAEDLKALTKKE